MTHFVIGVIIPKEVMKQENKVESYIVDLMSPYNEELEIEPYIDKTAKEVKEEFEEFKKNLQKEIVENKVSEYKKEYVKDNKIKEITINEWVKTWDEKELDKEGNLLTTYNTDCFWDWYRIGGRWNGLLTENMKRSEDGFNFSDEHETISNNSISVKDLLEKVKDKQSEIMKMELAKKEILENLGYVFGGFGFTDIFREYIGKEKIEGKDEKFYKNLVKRFKKFIKDFEFNNPFILSKILSVDGLVVWKDFGYWGMSENRQSQQDYLKEYIKLLEKYKDDFIVNLDCHI